MHRGYSVPGVVTGKPIAIGGSRGPRRRHRPGRRLHDRGCRRGGSGSSSTGRASRSRASATSARPPRACSTRPGAQVVAITDVGGGVYDADGLDVRRLPAPLRGARHASPARRARSRSTTRRCSRSTSTSSSSRRSRARSPPRMPARVRARILAEAANGPVDPVGRPDPPRAGVTVIPDILCNAGGVIVSYFEWAQNRAALAWTLDEVNERLRRQILAAADAVWQRAAAEGIPPRLARPLRSPSSASPRPPGCAASTPDRGSRRSDTMSCVLQPAPRSLRVVRGVITGRPSTAWTSLLLPGCADGGRAGCTYEADLAEDGVDGLGMPFLLPGDPRPVREP